MATAERLSRERILDVALRLAERDGLGELSMRRLAQELDVWPMSIYRYFQDKEALLDALGSAAADRIQAPTQGGSWRSRMSRLLRQARQVLITHPAGSRLRLGEAPAGVEILRDAGFDALEAAQAWQALLSYTAGAALEADEGDFEYGLERLLDGLEARVA
jgi:AcrR family transcriptional regulator